MKMTRNDFDPKWHLRGINKPLHLFYIYIGGAVVVDKIIIPAAYMQLETPSEVAIAVRMLIAIWITIFQVSFFIIFYFLGLNDRVEFPLGVPAAFQPNMFR